MGSDALAAVQDLDVMRRDAQLDLCVHERVRDAAVMLLADDLVVDVHRGGPVAGEPVAVNGPLHLDDPASKLTR